MVGVDRYSYIHCSLIKDMLQDINPELVFVQIPCDEPYFVKNHHGNPDNYRNTWKLFTQYNKSPFFVSPRPKFFSDLILSKEKASSLIRENITPTEQEFEIGNDILYSLDLKALGDKNPDCFLTTILYQHLRGDKGIQTIMGGFPDLVLRDFIAKTYSVEEVEEIWQKYKISLQNQQLGFEGLYFFENAQNLVADYTAEVLKQASMSNDLVLAIVNRHQVNQIEEAWKFLSPKIEKLDYFLQFERRNKLFVEYIQKLTAADLILGDIIQAYWIQYNTFPYNVREMLDDMSGTFLSVFDFWRHYYDKRHNEIGMVTIDPEDAEKYRHSQKYQTEMKSSNFNVFEEFEKKEKS